MTGSYTVQIGLETLEISFIRDMERFRALIDERQPRIIEEWREIARAVNSSSSDRLI